MFNVLWVVLSRASIFALGSCRIFGVDHYPLLTVVHPTLAEIKKKESGRRKISQHPPWYFSAAIFQSIGITTGLPNMPGMQGPGD